MTYKPNLSREKDFSFLVNEIEMSDSKGRKLSHELHGIGEELYLRKVFDFVKIFNWLSDSRIKEHEKNGLKYIELIPSKETMKLFYPFQTLFLDQGFGKHCLNSTKASGVFIRKDGKTVWQYPEYNRKAEGISDIASRITLQVER